jgi:hypothetical protein
VNPDLLSFCGQRDLRNVTEVAGGNVAACNSGIAFRKSGPYGLHILPEEPAEGEKTMGNLLHDDEFMKEATDTNSLKDEYGDCLEVLINRFWGLGGLFKDRDTDFDYLVECLPLEIDLLNKQYSTLKKRLPMENQNTPQESRIETDHPGSKSGLSLFPDDVVLTARFNNVIGYYPKLAKDYSKLKDVAFREGTENLIWLFSKQALTEYFGNQRENQKWEYIENLFLIQKSGKTEKARDLKNSFSNNGNAYQKKPSKDYEKILQILNTPESK